MDKYVVLLKTDFDGFVEKLAKSTKVVAPVAQGYNNYAYEEVRNGKEVALKHLPTILPPKKYFMPQCEKLVEYNKEAKTWDPILESVEMVILGIHTCDLAGLSCLDNAMTASPKDVNFIARQAGITKIGIECNDICDKNCTCAVMGTHLPSDGYDLFFTELKNSYLVHVATDKGEKIVQAAGVFKDAQDSDMKELEALRKHKEKVFKPEVNVSRDELQPLFQKTVESKVWEDVGNRCVSCGNCTNVCPTCYCFDICDDMNLDLNTGSRSRVWDGCQSETFAQVAGGENFREERGNRQRHRYLRKFDFPVDRFGAYFCIGCGRCTRTCMAKISLKETINDLAKDAK